MPSLAELQAELAGFVLSPPGRVPDATLRAAVRAAGAPAEERLAVYKNNVYARLIDALAATYPAIERLVGTEFFRHAAREYVAIHAPRAPTLLRYGEVFPQFLARFAPAATVPYLPDVAALEFLYLEAYHAAEAAALSAEAFASALAAPDDAPAVALHPSARLMESRFPVSRIWELNRQPELPQGKKRIPSEHEYLLIVRPRATVEVRRVSRAAFVTLGALAAGQTLSAALAAGAEVDTEAELSAHLAALAAGETFCSGDSHL